MTTRRRSLESERHIWDNRSTVIKHLALAVVLALSVSACQKSTDLGRVQEESVALVKVHVAVLDQLQRRADALLVRGRSVASQGGSGAQGIADAGRLLTEASAQLDQLRSATLQAPAAFATAAKTGNEEQMHKTSDELVEKLEDGATLVRADLDAIENWLAFAEVRPAPTVTPTTPASNMAPTSAPTGQGAPAAAGSAAPAKTP